MRLSQWNTILSLTSICFTRTQTPHTHTTSCLWQSVPFLLVYPRIFSALFEPTSTSRFLVLLLSSSGRRENSPTQTQTWANTQHASIFVFVQETRFESETHIIRGILLGRRWIFFRFARLLEKNKTKTKQKCWRQRDTSEIRDRMILFFFSCPATPKDNASLPLQVLFLMAKESSSHIFQSRSKDAERYATSTDCDEPLTKLGKHLALAYMMMVCEQVSLAVGRNGVTKH